MGEMTASAETIVKHLNALIAIDYDAIEAYKAAIDRLRTAADQDQLRSFLADHRRHVFDLTPFVREFHGEPVTEADFKRFLTRARVVFGGLIGDRAILDGMNTNEEEATKAYKKASTEPGIPSRVRAVIERNLADERRHLAWLQQRIGSTTLLSERH